MSDYRKSISKEGINMVGNAKASKQTQPVNASDNIPIDGRMKTAPAWIALEVGQKIEASGGSAAYWTKKKASFWPDGQRRGFVIRGDYAFRVR